MFEIPSRDDLAREFLLEYEAAFQGARSIAKGSDGWILGRVVSGVAWGIVARLVALYDNALPDRAVGEWLRRWAWLLSVPFKGPSIASGKIALLIAGVNGVTVNAGTELAAGDGTLFVTTANVTIAGGTATASIVARAGGASGNRPTGETLTFTAPPANVDPTAVLIADVTGGDDGEQEADYRPRLLDHLRRPLSGGSVSDFRKWATGDLGKANAAFIYRQRRGLGTIDIAALQAGSGANRIMADLSNVAQVIADNRPAKMKDVVLLTVQPLVVDVKVQLLVDATVYSWDWADGGGTVITAANVGAKTVTAPGCPAGAVVGKRVQIAGVQSVITNRAGNVLTLDSLSGTPVGHRVYSGGDLVAPVQASIAKYFDSLGPARGQYAAFFWPDTVRRAKISEAATTVMGVVDALVIAPGVNVTPADDYSTNIQLAVPGIIEVVQA